MPEKGVGDRKGLLLLRLAFLACALTAALASPPAARAAEGAGAIWRFDFRDVFYDATFVRPDWGVVVGARGRILTSHERYPNLWAVRESGTTELLTCLSFADERHGWAAGHGGIILGTTDGGRTWEVQRESAPENQPLFDIQFPTFQAGYACGAFDTFLKTADGGKSWEEIPTGLDIMLNGMAFADELQGYMVGEFGTVVRTRDGGASWEKLDTGDYQGSLFGITLLSEQEILVCGIAGKILRSEDAGETWSGIPSATDQSLFRGAAQGEEVVLAGNSGTILCSRDRGKHFIPRKDEDLTSFAGVCPHPGGGFLCLGDTGKIVHLQP
ncbi:MAG: YCF48-related protein [bacterium]